MTDPDGFNNVRLHYALWEDIPAEVQDLFAVWMGGRPADGKSFYQLYFYWYNIIHNAGHMLRGVYHKQSASRWDEEMAANQFAVAYWRAKGQAMRLLELEKLVRLALRSQPTPTPADQDSVAYFNSHFQEVGRDAAAYGYYQFNMLLSSLQRPLDLPNALRTLVDPSAGDGSTIPLLPDFPIDDDLPFRIVNDLQRTMMAYGLRLPEIQVICMYSPQLNFVEWD